MSIYKMIYLEFVRVVRLDKINRACGGEVFFSWSFDIDPRSIGFLSNYWFVSGGERRPAGSTGMEWDIRQKVRSWG